MSNITDELKVGFQPAEKHIIELSRTARSKVGWPKQARLKELPSPVHFAESAAEPNAKNVSAEYAVH